MILDDNYIFFIKETKETAKVKFVAAVATKIQCVL